MAGGSILDRARSDASRFITSGGFQTEITFYLNTQEYVINGLVPRHHVLYDTDGLEVNTSVSSISVSEQNLIDNGITPRINGEVNLLNTIISYADATGEVKEYKLAQQLPNDTLGILIFLIKQVA